MLTVDEPDVHTVSKSLSGQNVTFCSAVTARDYAAEFVKPERVKNN